MAAFEVWLKGFTAEVEDPVVALMHLFSISEERARKLAASVPVAVKKNATREIAERFARGLEKIGGEVELRAADNAERSGSWAEQRPSRSARSVAPSRQRTGRGLGPHPSSPDLPAFDSVPPEGLPRRRPSSSQLTAVAPSEPPSSPALDALDAPPPRRRSTSSSPAFEALDAPPPRRRSTSSSPALDALDAPPPRRRSTSSSPAFEALDAPPPRRRASKPTMPATSAVVASVLSNLTDESDGIEVAFADKPLARRQNATAVLGSAVAVRPPTIPAVVGRRDPTSFPPAPPETDDESLELAPSSFGLAPLDPPPVDPDVAPARPLPRSVPPSSRDTPSSPPRALSEPPGSHVPRSVIPAPLPGAPEPVVLPPLAPMPRPAPFAPPALESPTDFAAPIVAALAAVALVGWRVAIGASIFQGRASWTFGVWLEAVALGLLAASALRVRAISEGRAASTFADSQHLGVVLVFPVAMLINWAVGSTHDERAIVGGDLDARVTVLETIAAACERTAVDEEGCKTCCEAGMTFEEACQCVVPSHCAEGDASADACTSCCARQSGGTAPPTFLHRQGCVCNATEALFQ